MLINRKITKLIEKTLINEPKIIILYGPRQSGKTTLITELLKKINNEMAVFLNGDDLRTQDLLGIPDLQRLRKAIGEKKFLIIDEAQHIPNIGLSLKLLFDNLKLRIIASGSSSFDLANKINEPLTGRATIFFLYPIATSELVPKLPDLTQSSRLEEFLRFGMYPKVLTIDGEEEKERYLYDLVNNYLYKDILSFESVRKPKKVVDLLSLLSLQIGNEVSLAELSKHLAISKIIIEKYLDLLEKMFVIVNLRGFSRNLRKEIYKTSKYYFLDLGLRNALIRNFNPLNLRIDSGAIFENFFLIERMKAINNQGQYANYYFWRTYDQKEIDLIEERDGQLIGYEIKWQDKKISPPKEWLATYQNAKFIFINQKNYLDYLG